MKKNVSVLIAAMLMTAAMLTLTANVGWAKTWDVKLAWDANQESDLKEYRLYENGSQVAIIPAGTEEVTRQLGPGTYEWYLTAVDWGLNESGPSNSVGITLDEVPPSAPTFKITIGVSITTDYTEGQ